MSNERPLPENPELQPRAGICFICKRPNDMQESICSECAKQWIRNPVGLDLTTGKPLTVRHPFSWWLRAEDLVVAAQVLVKDWRSARKIYFGGLPIAKVHPNDVATMPGLRGWLLRLRALLPLPQRAVSARIRLTPKQQHAHGRLRVIAVAEMLIGMAVECAAKTIIIGTDSTVVDDKQRWDALTRDHNLARYIDQTPVGPTLTAPERRLLTRLQEAIEWRGRYPGSKKQPDVHMQVSSEAEFEGWEGLWRKLYEHARYQPWSPPASPRERS